MLLNPYNSARLRDAVARAIWTLPHDVRRSLILRTGSGQRKLFETMRNHGLGEIPGQSVSLKGFDRHKCIFVHIPKCAGISVGRSLFGAYEGNHMGIPTYQVIYSKAEFDSYFKFTFVRNPWDRLLSAYTFMVKGGDRDHDGDHPTAIAQGEKPDRSAKELIKSSTEYEVREYADFEHFVTTWLSPQSMRVHEHFRQQYRFVCSPDGKLQLDHIGRFENLADDLSTISERLGVETTLVHHNRTHGESMSYRNSYTPKMRQIVADLYRSDIEMFGYSFDDG